MRTIVSLASEPELAKKAWLMLLGASEVILAASWAAGAVVDFRLAADRGEYMRVGELGPESTAEELEAPYTLREVVSKARAGGKSAPVGIGLPTRADVAPT